ncbi:MAG: agmatine deiminase family protein [Gammaproteobacteria bacterium]|nr:agmatine deiminase family protein [Gammaproteobacteria bacterium]
MALWPIHVTMNAVAPRFLSAWMLALMVSLSIQIFNSKKTMADGETLHAIRVPAEWEPQEAIWLQWPGRYEKTYETAFGKMATVISDYQKLHIIHDNDRIRKEAETAIWSAGGNPDHDHIVWHKIRNDGAWMRDNGPVYVIQDGEMRIQNWQFDAWGGAFGADIPFEHDNAIPDAVGKFLDMPVDRVNIVHERGNLEFNGVDTVLLNWSTMGDPRRNPGYVREQAKRDLKKYFGVSKVVFVQGVPEGDLTNGHIDGIARFINPTTVVVPECTRASLCKPGDGKNDQIFDDAAQTIKAAGFTVIRHPIEGVGTHKGVVYDANYMNWIVGNGFVIAVGFDNPGTDASAKRRIESYFPGRDVHIIEMLGSWMGGGGAHCHTNDQPAFSTIHFQ